jgi:ATP-dependent Clp protease ATP-binding subunit ClpA
MFERFSDRARRVLVLAQEEARLLNHSFIGTEHVLLGLIHEGEGVAALALERCGITLEAVRNGVEEIVGPATDPPSGSPPFTPGVKKVLELALREALDLGHTFIGTEHLLLGLLRQGDGVAVQILVSLDADLEDLREDVCTLMSGPREYERSVRDGHGLPPEADPPHCPHCRAGLAEQARYRMIDVPAENPEATGAILSMTVIYCQRCGNALGTA